MEKIFFTKQMRQVEEILAEVEGKLDKVENEEQLSLENLELFRDSIKDLLNTIEDEISNWK